MAPLTALALALIGGIVIGIQVDVPLLPASVILVCLLIVAVRWSRRAASGDRAFAATVAILLAFIILGAIVISIAPQPETERKVSSRPENPTYEAIAAQAQEALEPGDAALFLAIVFGDQQQVEYGRKEAFRRAGLLHIFAASGFNVTLAAAFIMLIARAFRAPKLLAGAMGLLSIVGYFWLVGPSPSVTRATLMAVLLSVALFSGRRVDPLASTAAAALIMLSFSPWSLLDIGWQLSFASLLGILIIYPWSASLIEPRIERLVAPLTVTLSAQVGVAPILIYYFGQVSTVAVIVNPLVTAVVAVITGIGFGASLLGLVWGMPARLLMRALSPLLAFVRETAEFFAALPAATVQFEPSLVAASVFTIIVLLAGYTIKRRLSVITLPMVIILVLGLQAGGIWVDLAGGIPRAAVNVHFLDVGQGDATLITAPGSGVVLIDGGDDYRSLDQDLRQRGIRKIDLLILSHAHSDHLGALDEIINTYPVGSIIESGFAHPTGAYRRFRAAARQQGVRVDQVRAGDMYSLGELRIRVLWPGKRFIRGSSSDVNNNSLVVKITYDDFSALFPGDVQLEAIERLTAGSADLTADVFKVSHQGADNGTTVNFLRHVRARYAVISAGKGNPYGHPHQTALAKLQRYVPELSRTDLQGDIYIGSDGRRAEFVR